MTARTAKSATGRQGQRQSRQADHRAHHPSTDQGMVRTCLKPARGDRQILSGSTASANPASAIARTIRCAISMSSEAITYASVVYDRMLQNTRCKAGAPTPESGALPCGGMVARAIVRAGGGGQKRSSGRDLVTPPHDSPEKSFHLQNIRGSDGSSLVFLVCVCFPDVGRRGCRAGASERRLFTLDGDRRRSWLRAA